MNILTFDIGVTNIRYALCDEQFRLSDVHTVLHTGAAGRPANYGAAAGDHRYIPAY